MSHGPIYWTSPGYFKPRPDCSEWIIGVYVCMLGSLGYSSFASRSSDSWETVGLRPCLSYSWAVGTLYFPAHFISLHFHSFLHAIFFCFFVVFQSYCPHAQGFGTTLVREIHVSYSHTEWNLLFGEAT